MPRYNKYFGVLEGRADARAPASPQSARQEAAGHHQLSPNLATLEAPSADDQNTERLPRFRFFDPDRLPAYVRHLENKPRNYFVGFDEFDAGHDWNSDAFPLALCEFLAYKSALAYERPARIEQNLLREHPRGIASFKFFDSRNRYGHTQAYGFVLSRTAYIVFRGTEFLTWADWATDFDTALTTKLDRQRYETEQRWIGAQKPGRHTGFAIAWGHVRAEVYDWIDRVLANASVDRIVLSGHSLGGALAKLAAFDIATHPTQNYQVGAVITFGAPLVGDDTFKTAYENAPGLARRTIRIAASLDLITMLTLAPFSYRHVGREWHLNKRPAYSRWRMYLFTPLLDPTEEAEKKVKAKRKSQVDQADETDPIFSPLSWLALRAVWFLIRLLRRTQAAHSVNQRYALFLSALSYRALRQHYRDDYDASHARLLDHLAYIRGDVGRLFGVARDGPIRIKSKSDEEYLTRYFKHFIV